MNTQPNIYNTQAKKPDEERRWNRFVVEWNEFVEREFRENCTRLWPNHGRDAVEVVDISLPSALLSQDGCERQDEHTDYKDEPEFANVFSVIAVFGVHARIVHIREFVCTLFPGDYVMFAGDVDHSGGEFKAKCTCPTTMESRCQYPLFSLCCVCMGVHSYFRANKKLPKDIGKSTYPTKKKCI